MRKIWVLCGGPSTEYEVSLNSAKVVLEEIDLTSQSVRPVVITRGGGWLVEDREMLADSDRKWACALIEDAREIEGNKVGSDLGTALTRMSREKISCVFLALHGQFGEDGCLQGVLASAGVPYTGSDVLASAMAFNKGISIELFRSAGLATARSIRFSANRQIESLYTLKLPVFVKPLRGGSSVGMSFVRTRDDLQNAIEMAMESDVEAIVEEAVEGIEVSCGVVDRLDGNHYVPVPLIPTEIRPVKAEYFDYDAKYVAGMSREITPPDLPPKMIARIQECALAAHVTLGCEGISRTDMIVPGGEFAQPVILETNTLPGLTRTSLLPQQALASGIEITDLFNGLIDHAIWRKKARSSS